MVSKGIGGHTRAHHGRTSDWITPRSILEALGPFDLDPCACTQQPWATASRMLTPAEDGLTQPWRGRVWLNPPYGPDVGSWMRRMAEHNWGTALVFARTETAWFHDWVWGHATAWLFLRGRLHFCWPDGATSANNAGGPSVLIAWGRPDAEILRTCRLDGAFVQQRSDQGL